MTWGGVVSSVTVMLAVPTAPSCEVALAVTMFGPSASGRAMLNLPSFPIGAGMELIVTTAVGSSTVPVTVVGLMLRYPTFSGNVSWTTGVRV